MPDDLKLAADILQAMDCTILKRRGPYDYTVIGLPPAYYNELFPPTDEGPCCKPWEYSEMLRFFMDDAEDFFENGGEGHVVSGLWQEENLCEAMNDELAFSAEAFELSGRQVIVFKRLTDEFSERIAVMRTARQQLLERRMLDVDLEKYKRKASFDSLTKVFNRDTFMELLKRTMVLSASTNGPLALALMDIDSFKEINDTYGHLAGDLVLSSMGQILRSNLRREDAVARYGGDEFIIFIPHAGPEALDTIFEKLRKSVEEHAFGTLPQVTISIGYTLFSPGEETDNLIERADTALYESKRAGRNRVTFKK